MRWTLLPLDRSGLGTHRDEWARLHGRLHQGHPMTSAAFVDAALRQFGDGREHLAIARAGDGSTAAMVVLTSLGRGRWRSFAPSQAQVCPLLAPPRFDAVELLRALPGWAWSLDLHCVDPALPGAPHPRLHDARLQALTMTVRLAGNFDTYWNARPSGLRQNLRRYERKAAADGRPVDHRVLRDPDQMAGAVDRYAALESQGWKGTQGTALAPGNEQAIFYSGLLREEAAVGRAEVHELWLGDELAASRLALVGPAMVVMLKTTYSEALDRYAPGRVLLRLALASMFEHHAFAVVEFYTDATQDQLAWATDTRAIRHLGILRHPSLQRAVLAARVLRAGWARRRAARSDDDWQGEVQAGPGDGANTKHCIVRKGEQVGAEWAATPGQSLPGHLDLQPPDLRRKAGAAALAAGLCTWLQAVPGLHLISLQPMPADDPRVDEAIAAFQSVGWVPIARGVDSITAFGNAGDPGASPHPEEVIVLAYNPLSTRGLRALWALDTARPATPHAIRTTRADRP